MVTRNGIYLDFTQSPYRFTVDNNTYVFSSDLHLVKFQNQYRLHREELSLKLKSRFQIDVKLTSLADMVLYQKIEKRGFLVVDGKGNKLCKENLIFVGERAISKN
jgi:YHS domain-containing protein